MKTKILVVDDEDFQRDLLKKLLSKEGYYVEEAQSPEVALSILEKEEFQVIITDLIMLDMDGVEFCHRVRETNSKTVIIALTGYADLYDIEKLKAAGFDNYLTKPIKVEIIRQAVEEGLKRSKSKARSKR